MGRRTEDNNIGGSRNGVTKHAKGMKLIKLFVLTSHPERPGVKSLEFAPRKRRAKGHFRFGSGINGLSGKVGGDREGVETPGREADGGNRADVGKAEGVDHDRISTWERG